MATQQSERSKMIKSATGREPLATALVYIVDDDPAARASVAALVRSRNLETREFASAEEFLTAYAPRPHECLVVDVRMPGMTGLQLQEQLVGRGYHLPVIVITGYADVPLAVRAMRAGAFTFLEKPCRELELWESIASALSQSGQAGPSAGEDVRERLTTLTPVERQILDMMLVGTPNKVIAIDLRLGLRTVELRRASMMKKMQADSLVELIRLALSADVRPSRPPLPPASDAPGE